MRALRLAVLLLGALPASAAANAAALAPTVVPATDLADATGAMAPSAARGHVVFSRRAADTGRYQLMAFSPATGLRPLPLATRAVPFDADVGTDTGGRPVVTISWCGTDGMLVGVLPTVDLSLARGCRPSVLDLSRAGATWHPLRLSGVEGVSLTSPSMYRGAVAAVAAPARAGERPRILYWRSRAHAPVRLRGGTAPRCPFRRCAVPPRAGIDALDLGPRSVAFLWRLSLPGYGAGPGVELRTSSLRPRGPGRQLRVGQGYLSGACGFRQPLSPSAGAGGGVAFLLAQSPCATEATATTLAVQHAGAGAVLGARPAGALAYGAAFDGKQVFWLRGAAPARASEAEPTPAVGCAAATAACRLVVSPTLPLAPFSGG